MNKGVLQSHRWTIRGDMAGQLEKIGSIPDYGKKNC
jgi:hypothetical protein